MIPCIPLLLSFACSGPDDGGTSADTTSDGDTSAGITDSGDEPTTTMGSPAGAPMVMEMLANTTNITKGEPITFTAIVIDPDGLDTIVGGKLMTEDGTGFYGAFAHIGGGTFQILLTWELIGQTSTIEFKGASQVRVFLADFIDVDGNHGTKTIEITLGCDSGAACDSKCVDLMVDDFNCGICGRACDPYDYEASDCNDGECGFSYVAAYR